MMVKVKVRNIVSSVTAASQTVTSRSSLSVDKR